MRGYVGCVQKWHSSQPVSSESVFRDRLHSINNGGDFDKNLPSPVRWPAAAPHLPRTSPAPFPPSPRDRLSSKLFLPIPRRQGIREHASITIYLTIYTTTR